MNDAIYNIPKGARTFSMMGIHDRLALIVYGSKNEPGEAEEKDETI